MGGEKRMEKVIRAFEETLFWLKRFREDPENPEVDMKVIEACEKAIVRYIEWMYLEEEDYKGLYEMMLRVLSRICECKGVGI